MSQLNGKKINNVGQTVGKIMMSVADGIEYNERMS